MTRTTRSRYLAYCDQGAWTVECGAINGVPDQPETVVALALYPEARSDDRGRHRTRGAGRAPEERD